MRDFVPVALVLVVAIAVAVAFYGRGGRVIMSPINVRMTCEYGTYEVRGADGFSTPHCIVPSPSPSAQARR